LLKVWFAAIHYGFIDGDLLRNTANCRISMPCNEIALQSTSYLYGQARD